MENKLLELFFTIPAVVKAIMIAAYIFWYLYFNIGIFSEYIEQKDYLSKADQSQWITIICVRLAGVTSARMR